MRHVEMVHYENDRVRDTLFYIFVSRAAPVAVTLTSTGKPMRQRLDLKCGVIQERLYHVSSIQGIVAMVYYSPLAQLWVIIGIKSLSDNYL